MTAAMNSEVGAASRERLPNRRPSETINFTVARDGVPSQDYVATIGYRWDGRIGEIFVRSGKSGSDVSIQTQETAIAVSFALQFGCPLETIRKAMPRTNDGRPEGVIGTLLDILAVENMSTK